MEEHWEILKVTKFIDEIGVIGFLLIKRRQSAVELKSGIFTHGWSTKKETLNDKNSVPKRSNFLILETTLNQKGG